MIMISNIDMGRTFQNHLSNNQDCQNAMNSMKIRSPFHEEISPSKKIDLDGEHLE